MRAYRNEVIGKRDVVAVHEEAIRNGARHSGIRVATV